MKCQIETYKGITIVTPTCERLDVTNYNKLREALDDSLPSIKDLLLDMEAVAFIDSRALGGLISLRKIIHANEGKLRICGVNGALQEIFELVRLGSVIPLYETRQLALSESGNS